MTTFVLVPGAGGQAWYWHRVVPRLAFRGHDAVAVELPAGRRAGSFRGLRAHGGASRAARRRAGLGRFRPRGGRPVARWAGRAGRRPAVLRRPARAGGTDDPRPRGDRWRVVAGDRPGRGLPALRGGPGARPRRRWTTTPSTSTTSRRACGPRRCGGRSSRPTARSGTRGRSTAGPTCRRGWSRAAVTGSSRPTSSPRWPGSGSVSTPTSSTPGTWRPSPTPTPSSTCSTATPREVIGPP